MIAADAQKSFTLRFKGGLITDGMYRFIGHPNYLGEMITYGSFALMVWHWLPLPRIEREQHLDDERESFAQLTWLDKRTTSGSWRIAKDSPNFPAWTCKVVGGTTVHWTACPLRAQEHEFRAKDVYGDIAGANLLNWPLTPLTAYMRRPCCELLTSGQRKELLALQP